VCVSVCVWVGVRTWVCGCGWVSMLLSECLSVRVSECECVSVRVCIYECMCVCAREKERASGRESLFVLTRCEFVSSGSICMFAYMHICMHVYIYMYVYVYVYVDICIYKYT